MDRKTLEAQNADETYPLYHHFSSPSNSPYQETTHKCTVDITVIHEVSSMDRYGEYFKVVVVPEAAAYNGKKKVLSHTKAGFSLKGLGIDKYLSFESYSREYEVVLLSDSTQTRKCIPLGVDLAEKAIKQILAKMVYSKTKCCKHAPLEAK